MLKKNKEIIKKLEKIWVLNKASCKVFFTKTYANNF